MLIYFTFEATLTLFREKTLKENSTLFSVLTMDELEKRLVPIGFPSVTNLLKYFTGFISHMLDWY